MTDAELHLLADWWVHPTTTDQLRFRSAFDDVKVLGEYVLRLEQERDSAIASERAIREESMRWQARAEQAERSLADERQSWQRHREKALTESARLGAKPGDLIQEYRDREHPVRFDWQRAYAAVVEALTQEGIAAWPGDGTGIVVDMIHTQIQRAEQAEQERDEARRELVKARRAVSDLDALATDPKFQQPDWDPYGAEPIDARAIEAVRQFLRHGASVVPINNGGLQLEWHCADLDMELEFDKTGRPVDVFAYRASDKASIACPDDRTEQAEAELAATQQQLHDEMKAADEFENALAALRDGLRTLPQTSGDWSWTKMQWVKWADIEKLLEGK